MPEAKVIQLELSTPPAHPSGRDEMNLAEFPLTLLTDSVKDGQQSLYFESPQGTLTVTGSQAFGLPTARDADVIVALMCLTKKRNNFTSPQVNFSRYELLKELGWADVGKSYRRLDESFNRWTGVLLIYDRCWWNNRRRRYTSAKMHIIDSVEFADADTRGHRDELPFSTFTWNQTFIESCQADNLRSLDSDIYRSFSSALAKRLYRFLGKRFYLQDDLTFDLKELALERVGISRNYTDAGKIKEKLQPALEELEAIGFLEPLDRAARYTRIEKGQWTIRLCRPSPLLAVQPASLPSELPDSPAVAELVSRGVTKHSALALVAEFPAEEITRQIEHFDFLAVHEPHRVSKSPSGFLSKSIRGGYAAPHGFTSKAEQERKQAERAASEQKDQKKRTAASRAKAQAQAADDAARARLAAMTPEDRQTIEQAALEAAGEESRQTIAHLSRQKKGGGAGFRESIILAYLKDQAPSGLTEDPA